MSQEHHIAYLPGLNDRSLMNQFFINLLPYFWDSEEFPIHVIYPHWYDGESFDDKFPVILAKIDELIRKYTYVSIIGQSAGGSAALNTYVARINDLVACVDVTGRTSEGVNVFPTLEQAAINSPAFRNSVRHFERSYEPLLDSEGRKRILTVRPRLDLIVPHSTVAIEGATNIVAPMIGHVTGGFYIMSKYSWVIKNFLRRKASTFKKKKIF